MMLHCSAPQEVERATSWSQVAQWRHSLRGIEHFLFIPDFRNLPKLFAKTAYFSEIQCRPKTCRPLLTGFVHVGRRGGG